MLGNSQILHKRGNDSGKPIFQQTEYTAASTANVVDAGQWNSCTQPQRCALTALRTTEKTELALQARPQLWKNRKYTR